MDTSESCGSRRRLKILFLGNAWNPFSTRCLEGLADFDHDVFVGSFARSSRGLWNLLKKTSRDQGWRPALRKVVQLTRCKTHLVLRRAGLPLARFASVPELCRARGLTMLECTDPNGAAFVQRVKELEIDLIVVAAFSRILKKPLIEAPAIACINMHSSLLPLYRGPEPFYWVLANREQITGVTLHHVDDGIDTGDIILQRELEIPRGETEAKLRRRCAELAVTLLSEVLPDFIAGTAPRSPQNHSRATYYPFPPKKPRKPAS